MVPGFEIRFGLFVGRQAWQQIGTAAWVEYSRDKRSAAKGATENCRLRAPSLHVADRMFKLGDIVVPAIQKQDDGPGRPRNLENVG